MDNLSSITKARETGLAEGEHNAKIELAKNMLSDGMSVEIVSKYSGLPAEEIAQYWK